MGCDGKSLRGLGREWGMLKDAEKWYLLCTWGRLGGREGDVAPGPKPRLLFRSFN